MGGCGVCGEANRAQAPRESYMGGKGWRGAICYRRVWGSF